jgi:hypothetical protein
LWHASSVRRYLVLLAAWAVFRAVQRWLVGPGFGDDPFLYLSYARAWGAGAAPYVDFHPEYPPAALLLFVVPFLAGGAHYLAMLQAEMALFDLGGTAAVLAFATRLWPNNVRRQVAAVAGYLVATAVLNPVLFWRFDIVPAALTVGALVLAASRRELAGAVLLGLGGSIKLWPLVLAPLWLGSSLQRSGWRRAATETFAMGVGLAVPLAMFVFRAGAGIFDFLQFHSQRALQLESTWANAQLLLDAFGLSQSRITYDHRAFHVHGGAMATLRAAARVATLLFVFAPQAVALQRRVLAAEDLPVRAWLVAAASSLVGLVAAASVLSPQFIIWIVPLLVLLEAPGIAAAVALAALTTVIYPVLYDPLVLRRPPQYGIALACLSVRNLLLLIVYGVLVWRLVRLPPLAAGGSGKPDTTAAAA